MPDRNIPELKLLSEEDWLELSKEPLGHDPGEVHLDDESTARLVFSAIRAKAKERLVPTLSKALEQYVTANNGLLPTDPNQLEPYTSKSIYIGPGHVEQAIESSLDGTILNRYAFLQTGRFEDVPKDGVIIAEKGPPVDTRYDTRAKIGEYWYQVDNDPGAYSEPPVRAD